MKALKTTLIVCLLIFFSCDTETTEQSTSETGIVESSPSARNIIESEKGNFRIAFPDFEVSNGQTKLLEDGEEITVYHYSVNCQDEEHANLGYRVDYTFCPHIKNEAQIDELFNNQRDYVLSATNSQLELETIIDTLEYPGRELHLTIDNSTIKTRYRMLFHDGILYKLMVLTQEGNLFNKEITGFLNSFEILK